MDRSQYTAKVSDILSSNSYRPLKKNHIPSIEKRVASKLLVLHHADALTIQLYRHLRPSCSSCPRFFRQLKIHKPDVPLRPVFASRGSPTYNTPRYLAKILHPLAGLTQHHVSNVTPASSLRSPGASLYNPATSWLALTLSPSSPMSQLQRHASWWKRDSNKIYPLMTTLQTAMLLPSPQHQVISQPHPCTTRLRHMWPRQLTQGTTAHQDYPPATIPAKSKQQSLAQTQTM